MQDPLARFRRLLERARREEAADATAGALGTADRDGRPSVRMVLLKDVDARGFVFYTNVDSRKAQDLAANPRAALCFYWPALAVQVRVEGAVEGVSGSEADAYFATRPRLAQIGAWASKQSARLPSRARLLGRAARIAVRFARRDVPRPRHWGGYRLVPERIEFWKSRTHRLHDRRLYCRTPDGWTTELLYP